MRVSLLAAGIRRTAARCRDSYRSQQTTQWQREGGVRLSWSRRKSPCCSFAINLERLADESVSGEISLVGINWPSE